MSGVYSHAGAYDACADTTLISLCDSDEATLSDCSLHWGVKNTYTSIDEFLEKENPEIVSICTPDNTHAQITRKVLGLSSVRGVLIEKPLALNLQEAEDIVTLAADRDIVLAVNYSRRYAPGHDRVRQLIENGGIGKVQMVTGYYTKGVLHNGTHWLDLARFLIGDVAAVQGLTGLKCEGPGSDSDPNLDVQLAFASGGRGHLFGCSADLFSVFEMDIVGSRGRVRIIDSGHNIEHYLVADSEFYTDYKSLKLNDSWDGGLDNSMIFAIENLVECVAYGKVPLCSGHDGLEALKLGIAAIESRNTNVPELLVNS